MPRRKFEVDDDRRSLRPDIPSQSTDDDGNSSARRRGRSRNTSSSDDLPERRREHGSLSRVSNGRRLERYGRDCINEVDEVQAHEERSSTRSGSIRTGKISSMDESYSFENSNGRFRY